MLLAIIATHAIVVTAIMANRGNHGMIPKIVGRLARMQKYVFMLVVAVTITR